MDRAARSFLRCTARQQSGFASPWRTPSTIRRRDRADVASSAWHRALWAGRDPAEREILGMTVIRPLIDAGARRDRRVSEEEKIRPRIDKSNAEEVYFRNKIRNTSGFLQKEYSPRIKRNVGLISRKARGMIMIICCRRLRSITFSLAPAARDFARRPIQPCAGSLSGLAVAAAQGDTRRITFTHIREIETSLFHRPCGSVVDLPQYLSVIKSKTHLVFSSAFEINRIFYEK